MQISLPTTAETPSPGSSAPPYPFPAQALMAPDSFVNTAGTALLRPRKMVWIQLVTATASLPDQVLVNVFSRHYLRVTNTCVLILLTHSFLFEEVFSCLLPDFCFLHWNLPGFNQFSSSYLQTCHSSCSYSTIFFSPVSHFKGIVLLQNE